MPRIKKSLTVKEVNALPDGRHAVGGVKGLTVEKRDGKMDVRVSFFRTFRSPRNRNFPHSFQLSNFGSQRSFFRTLQPSGLEIRLD